MSFFSQSSHFSSNQSNSGTQSFPDSSQNLPSVPECSQNLFPSQELVNLTQFGSSSQNYSAGSFPLTFSQIAFDEPNQYRIAPDVDYQEESQRVFSQQSIFSHQSAVSKFVQDSSEKDSDDDLFRDVWPIESQQSHHTEPSTAQSQFTQQFTFDTSNVALKAHKVSQLLDSQPQQFASQEIQIPESSSQLDFHQEGDFEMPPTIAQLHNFTKPSDWAFVSVLAGQLCPELPACAYNNLKLSLLLSLASIDGNSSPLPIAAVGQETAHANAIMQSMDKYGDRFVVTTLANFEGTVVHRDGNHAAGALLMAKDGILLLGDWSYLQAKMKTKILRDIETGIVTSEKGQHSTPLECAIWTYWCCSSEIKKDIKTLNEFTNIFGLLVMIDDLLNAEEILDHILGDAIDVNRFHIPDSEMKCFLSYVSKQKVTLDPEANEMLENYFQATRMIRPNALSEKALDTMKQISLSHAKLCFRDPANGSDALAAIRIFENYIRVLFAKDLYSSPAEFKITSFEDIDAYQAQLYKWFCEFTTNISQR